MQRQHLRIKRRLIIVIKHVLVIFMWFLLLATVLLALILPRPYALKVAQDVQETVQEFMFKRSTPRPSIKMDIKDTTFSYYMYHRLQSVWRPTVENPPHENNLQNSKSFQTWSRVFRSLIPSSHTTESTWQQGNMKKKIHLISQWYWPRQEERALELIRCLAINLRNPHVHKIHLLQPKPMDKKLNQYLKDEEDDKEELTDTETVEYGIVRRADDTNSVTINKEYPFSAESIHKKRHTIITESSPEHTAKVNHTKSTNDTVKPTVHTPATLGMKKTRRKNDDNYYAEFKWTMTGMLAALENMYPGFPSHLFHQKVVLVLLPRNGRLLASDAILYASKRLKNEIAVLHNLDIYFDKSIYLVKSPIADLSLTTSYFLSRYEEPGSTSTSKTQCGPDFIGSHDAFVFIPPLPLPLIQKLQFEVGSWGFENRLLYEFQQYGIQGRNPCEDIHIWHCHNSNYKSAWMPEINTEQKSAVAFPDALASKFKSEFPWDPSQ